MNPCNKGWDDPLNSEGRCCCNCKFQLKLVKHPWNSDTLYKGRIIEQVMDNNGNDVYVCVMDTALGGDNAIAMDREHSMCEMHTFKGEDE